MLLARCTTVSGEARMEAALSQAALSYLWDHRVAGRALFPAAAMLEAAAAATLAMLSASGDANSAQAAVTGVSIPTPLVLPSTDQRTTAGINLTVTVLAAAGSIEAASGSGGQHSSRQTHLKAGAARILSPEVAGSLHRPQHAVLAAVSQALLREAVPMLELPASAGVAIASVAQAARAPGGRYLIHPAVIDNCTQAGAALSDNHSPSTNSSRAAVTRVPAGLRAYALRKRLQAPEAFASAAVVGLLVNGTAVSDYSLGSATDSRAGMAISGMLFKPVSGRPAAAVPQATSATLAAAAATSGASPQDALYELSWAVTQPGPTTPGRLLAQRRPMLIWTARSANSASKATLRLAASSSSTVLAGSLRFIQAQAAGGSAKASSIQLTSLAVHSGAKPDCAAIAPSRKSAALCEAGAGGLLRVAAQEFPATAWQHCHISSPAAAESSQSGPPADAFGISSAHGAWLASRLQRSATTAAPAPLHSIASSSGGRSVIVTGGLGDIGSLAGAWVAIASQAAPHVYLIGRTGRSQKLPQQLLHSEGAVHIVRCDVGEATEVDSLVQKIRVASPPLGGVVHAGGVLQDALLPIQVIISSSKHTQVLKLSCMSTAARAPSDGVPSILKMFASCAAALRLFQNNV